MNSLLKYLSFAVLLNLTISCSNNDSEEVYEDLPSLEERLHAGGETTVFLTSSNSYSTPAPNLSGTNLTDHLDGDVDFESVFVTAPATINQGLGTIFNNSSCISCHPRDGRPSFPTNINARSGFFLRVSLSGQLAMVHQFQFLVLEHKFKIKQFLVINPKQNFKLFFLI